MNCFAREYWKKTKARMFPISLEYWTVRYTEQTERRWNVSTQPMRYGVRAGFGGLTVKDGPIPHFADTNHAVPVNVFTVENGQINVQSIDAPAGTEEMCMADLRGVLREVYEEFIGGSENYTVLEEIEGSDQYFSTEVEPLP